MAAPTSSSNTPARTSLATGLLGTLALPVAIAVAQVSRRFELLDAWVAVPLALGLGAGALVSARAGRRRHDRTLGRAGGEGAVRAGRALGRLAVAIGLAGTIAITVYEALSRWE